MRRLQSEREAARTGVLKAPLRYMALTRDLRVPKNECMAALHALEAPGVVLRGSFTDPGEIEWCDRPLLAAHSPLHRGSPAPQDGFAGLRAI